MKIEKGKIYANNGGKSGVVMYRRIDEFRGVNEVLYTPLNGPNQGQQKEAYLSTMMGWAVCEVPEHELPAFKQKPPRLKEKDIVPGLVVSNKEDPTLLNAIHRRVVSFEKNGMVKYEIIKGPRSKNYQITNSGEMVREQHKCWYWTLMSWTKCIVSRPE